MTAGSANQNLGPASLSEGLISTVILVDGLSVQDRNVGKLCLKLSLTYQLSKVVILQHNEAVLIIHLSCVDYFPLTTRPLVVFSSYDTVFQ